MLKNKKQINKVLLPMGKECMNQYYKAFNEKDILHFIEEVVLNGNDSLKVQRENFAQNILKFNYPKSTNTILDYLKETLDLK